jgi:hypothetical protein
LHNTLSVTADVVSDILWVVSLQSDMKPFVRNSDDRGSAFNNIWRLTSSGDLAFDPGKVGTVSTTDPSDSISMKLSATPTFPVYDIEGNLVRSQMCGTADNPFATTSWDGYCQWGYDFSTRADYNQDTRVCVKFFNFYDGTSALNSFNGGADDNGALDLYEWYDDSFAPSFESGAFDEDSYIIDPYELYGSKAYYNVNMRDFKKANTVKYKSGSTDYAEDSLMQSATFCERMNAIYIGTITIFSFTMMLWIGKVLSLVYALLAKPTERLKTLLDFPFIGAVTPFVALAFPTSKQKLRAIEEQNQKEEKDEDTILSRVLGLRTWLSSELPCGAFTFTSTLCDSKRWQKHGTLDTAGNPRESVKFWEAICYPLVLPLSYTMYRSVRIDAERNVVVKFLYYCFVWPTLVGMAWGWWFLTLVSILLIGTWSVTFFSDHSITIKLIEDFPQMVMGYYYSTQVRYNGDAIFSATVSLLILTRSIASIALSIKQQAVKEIKEINSQEQQKLHRMYGDLSLGQMMWVTNVQPMIMISAYAWNFPLIMYAVWARKRRSVPESVAAAPAAKHPAIESPA